MLPDDVELEPLRQRIRTRSGIGLRPSPMETKAQVSCNDPIAPSPLRDDEDFILRGSDRCYGWRRSVIHVPVPQRGSLAVTGSPSG